MIQVPYYTPRLPMHSGGRMIDLTEDPAREMLIARSIGEALGTIYGPMKRERQIARQTETALPILQREGNVEDNIRAALDVLEKQRLEGRPKGLGAVVDVINPLAPARGPSALEQGLTERLMQPAEKGQIVKGADGKTYFVNPRTGEKRDLGIPAPTGKASTAIFDIWYGLSPTEGEELTPQEQQLKKALWPKVLEERGLEEVEDEEPYEYKPWFGKPKIKYRKTLKIRPKTTPKQTEESPISQALDAVTEKKGGIKLQSAPDVKLDRYWPQLSDDQKSKIWEAFEEGYTAEQIIKYLGLK